MTENTMPERLWVGIDTDNQMVASEEKLFAMDETLNTPITQYIRADLVPVVADLSKCPKCKGAADNGFDRCDPPNVYNCTKCEAVTDDKTDEGKAAAIELINVLQESHEKLIEANRTHVETIYALRESHERLLEALKEISRNHEHDENDNGTCSLCNVAWAIIKAEELIK